MTFEQAINTVELYVLSNGGVPKHKAIDAIAAIGDHVRLLEQRYADKEAVRLGHILRHVATPEQIYAAETAVREAHPEAWAGRLPIRPKDTPIVDTVPA